MLQDMLDCQAELCALMLVPPGLTGVQEASIGMVKEAAELIEEVHPGSRAWRRVDYKAADKEAIDVLLYLLEYFVLRGYDAEEVLQMYYAKAEIVAERQVSKEAADKVATEEYIRQDEFLSTPRQQIIFAVPIDGVSPDAQDALGSMVTPEALAEQDRQTLEAQMQEAIGDDCPGYVAGGGN